jgi:hypothetical protein
MRNINVNLVLLLIIMYFASTLTSGCRRPTPFKDWVEKWKQGRKDDDQEKRFKFWPDPKPEPKPDEQTEPDDQRRRDRWRLFPREEPCET